MELEIPVIEKRSGLFKRNILKFALSLIQYQSISDK